MGDGKKGKLEGGEEKIHKENPKINPEQTPLKLKRGFFRKHFFYFIDKKKFVIYYRFRTKCEEVER